DAALLDKALGLMVEKHTILRTSFYEEYKVPLQFVHKTANFEVNHFDLSGDNDQVEIIRAFLANDKGRPFITDSPGLFRLATFKLDECNYCICFICHHAIIDGWSDASFNTELINIYQELKKDI